MWGDGNAPYLDVRYRIPRRLKSKTIVPRLCSSLLLPDPGRVDHSGVGSIKDAYEDAYEDEYNAGLRTCSFLACLFLTYPFPALRLSIEVLNAPGLAFP